MQSRDLSIDTLRGLACVLLVAYHAAGTGYTSGSGLDLPADHPLMQANAALFYLRMPLFSFLSGLVYAARPFDGGFGAFALGKLRRLIIPMLVFGTLFAFAAAKVPGVHPLGEGGLIHIQPVGHFWFLESIFWSLMTVALVEHLGWLRRPGAFAVVLAAAIGVHALADLPRVLGLEGFAFLLPYVLIGIAVARFGSRLVHPQATLALAACAAAIVAFHTLVGGPWDEEKHPLSLLLSACLCVLVYRAQPRWRALAWIGRGSFTIYLLHVFFSAGSRKMLGLAGIPLPLAFVFSASLAAGILGPLAFDRGLRRWAPGALWLIGERAPRAKATPARVPNPGSADEYAQTPSQSSELPLEGGAVASTLVRSSDVTSESHGRTRSQPRPARQRKDTRESISS